MTTLIIARHGNTFGPGETPTRVGARTDLPLVESGEAQARALGRHLKAAGLVPSRVFTSQLMRTKQTAAFILEEMDIRPPVEALGFLNEVDYGPDENKPEEEVIARIGAAALKDWDEQAIVPAGWDVDPDAIIHAWQRFAHMAEEAFAGQTLLLVTSNGTARFAPRILPDYDIFARSHDLKLKTGAYGILSCRDGIWQATGWNIRP